MVRSGKLKIAEVKSRFESDNGYEQFKTVMQRLAFDFVEEVKTKENFATNFFFLTLALSTG